MKSYKANNKSELYYILIYAVVAIGGGLLTKKPITALYLGGIYIPLVCVYILFYTRLTEIQVDKKKGILTAIYSSHLRKKKEVVYKLENLEWGYKRNDTLKHGDNKTVAILYDAGKEVVKLKVDKDGWKNEPMYELVTYLQKSGVKRKFTGYMMKDAEV